MAPRGNGYYPGLNDTRDLQFVRAALAGDEAGFSGLVIVYEARLRNFVYRMIKDRERAEDLVQEAFLRVVRNLRGYDQTKKFSTWIYTIAANLAKNELRNRKRRHAVLNEASLDRLNPNGARYDFIQQHEDDRSPQPDVAAIRHEFFENVLPLALARLPRGYRDVLRMIDVDGVSYEACADRLKVNLGTVKSRLNRARAAMRAMLTPYVRADGGAVPEYGHRVRTMGGRGA